MCTPEHQSNTNQVVQHMYENTKRNRIQRGNEYSLHIIICIELLFESFHWKTYKFD